MKELIISMPDICQPPNSVHYEAGFHLPGPALGKGRGGYFGGDPHPAAIRGESPLIPWMGPPFSPPVLTGPIWGTGGAEGRGRQA